ILGTWLLIAAPIVAGLSFIRGYRRGGGPLRAAVLGLAATFIFFLPAWGRAAWRVGEFCRIDPTDASFHVETNGFFVGQGGRFAFLTARHWLREGSGARIGYSEFGSAHALVVDLESGNWHEVGDPTDTFFVPGWTGGSPIGPVLLLATVDTVHGGGWSLQPELKLVFDGRTGDLIGNERAKELVAQFGSFDHAIDAAIPTVRLPD